MKSGLLNVLPESTLKPLLTDVTEAVAKVLANTFGPYGKNTLVQSTSSVYATKDGWNVMQLLRVSDKKGENAIVVNALKKLIQDVAQSALLNAGDGTTTSILAAAHLNKKVTEYVESHKLDSRTLEEALTDACDCIVEELYKERVLVTDDNMRDIIYRIACISTNWDDEISRMIRDIYCETKNPIIKVEDSGNLDTTLEYIDGYELKGHLELPNYYLTSPAAGLFKAENPLILTFGSAVHKEILQAMILAGGILAERGRTLVISAPSYDADFLTALKAVNAKNVQQNVRPVNVVPFKYYAKTDIDKDCVEDFAVATGGIVFTNEYTEFEEVFGELTAHIIEKQNNAGKKPTETSKKNEEEILDRCISVLMDVGGTCDTVTATDKYILATGLTNMVTEEFERRKKKLENEIDMKRKQYNAESSLTEMIRVKRLRLGKMQCKMGVIKVGGFGAAHLKSKKDAIDDATRACEVAYSDGYIMDGGMAIPLAISAAIVEMDKRMDEIKSESSKRYASIVSEFLCLYGRAFFDVVLDLFDNKYQDRDVSESLAGQCLEKGMCYNLITEEFTKELITPVAVCCEELRACLRLVLTNATSNQFLFMNEDDLIRAIQRNPELNLGDDDEE